MNGTKQGSKQWYEKLHAALSKKGFKRSEADICLFYKGDLENLQLVGVYVDDLMLFFRKEEELIAFKEWIKTVFPMKDLGQLRYCLGFVIEKQEDGSILLHQKPYIESLITDFNMEGAYQLKVPAEPGIVLSKAMLPDDEQTIAMCAKEPYAQLVGSLLYASNGTRPDIAFATSRVSKFMAKHGPAHWKAAQRIVKYLKGTQDYVIKYPKPADLITDEEKLNYLGNSVWAHCDADFAGDVDTRRSTSGFYVSIGDGPWSYSSKIQSLVSTSTCDAEYVALSACAKEILYLRKFFRILVPVTEREMTKRKTENSLSNKKEELPEEFEDSFLQKVPIFCDNQAAIALAANPVHHSKTKHIEMKYHHVRDLIQKEAIVVKYISTKENIADIFTKPLPFPLLNVCREKFFSQML